MWGSPIMPASLYPEESGSYLPWGHKESQRARRVWATDTFTLQLTLLKIAHSLFVSVVFCPFNLAWIYWSLCLLFAIIFVKYISITVRLSNLFLSFACLIFIKTIYAKVIIFQFLKVYANDRPILITTFPLKQCLNSKEDGCFNKLIFWCFQQSEQIYESFT